MKMKRIGQGVSPTSAGGTNDCDDTVVPLRRYITATMFLFMNMLVFSAWQAFPLANTIFFDGYPRAGTPPSPNTFMSARYTWDWWVVWLLGLNAIVPFLFALALTNNLIEEYARVHRFFAELAMVANTIVIIILTVQWLFFCNGTFRFFGNGCSDYRWCCVNFPSDWCPNTLPCVPGVTNLDRNSESLQHWVFTFVFGLLAYWNVSVNKDLREFGLFH